MFRLLLILALLFAAPAVRAADAVMSAPEARAAVTDGTRVLIDLRTLPEQATTGVPQGALRIGWWRPGDPKGFVDDVLAAVAGDRSRPVALICAGGSRSSAARTLLLANGFTDVADVSEGVSGSAAGPGWRARGLPME
ncbi:MAG: rhodanese-like domain-containing protein [Pseudomonadota bacterium]|nr:rhodanese-like domain-containing protein [Pseudomonadota bacterium]